MILPREIDIEVLIKSLRSWKSSSVISDQTYLHKVAFNFWVFDVLLESRAHLFGEVCMTLLKVFVDVDIKASQMAGFPQCWINDCYEISISNCCSIISSLTLTLLWSTGAASKCWLEGYLHTHKHIFLFIPDLMYNKRKGLIAVKANSDNNVNLVGGGGSRASKAARSGKLRKNAMG